MLEANQIPAFIPDENMCHTWGYINAIGGVRVQVAEEFVEEAKAVLAQFKDKSSSAIVNQSSDLSEETAGAAEDQGSMRGDGVSHSRYPRRGGLLLVLLALAVAGVFLVLLECGNIQEAACLSAQEAYDKGDYDLAIADYSRSIRFGLRNELVYLNRGSAYIRKGDYDRAIADFNRAGQLEPQDEYVYLNRGLAYDDQGDYDKAIADDSRAIQLNPRDEYAYCNRGKAYCDKGEEDTALADFNQAVLLDPKDTQVYFNRGSVYQDKGENDQAIADYTQVIQIDPKGDQAADAYCNRALAYESKGGYDKAIQDCHQALSINPNQSYACTALAWLLATSPQANFRDGRKAVEVATRGCELTNWKSPDAVDTLAAACAEAGDFKNAVKWERKDLEFPNQKKSDIAEAQMRLTLYLANQPYHQKR